LNEKGIIRNDCNHYLPLKVIASLSPSFFGKLGK